MTPLFADSAPPAALALKLPPKTVALGSYQPQFPNDLSSVDQAEQASGKKQAIISWYALWGGWKRDFSASDLEAVSRRGSLPLITWEPWAAASTDPAWSLQQSVLSGRNDAYIDSWARGMAAYGKPVLLRFAHEMHDQAYPWAVGVNGNTAADYVAAWKHVHDIFSRYNTANVKWVWNPNTLGDASAATYDPIYRGLYPGDAYVDVLGLDIYNTGPNLNWGAPHWRSFQQALSEPYKAITAISSKPLILPEVGSVETGGSKAAWIRDALSQLPDSFPQVSGLVWFDLPKEDQWALHSSPAAYQAWIAEFGLPQFGLAGSQLT